MSEYQRIAFRAIDAPVSKNNLAFMRQQSTRAEITPWAFDNEYTFGDFHGDEIEMLRRGYDLHLHYANFGTRKLMLRFPNGLPNLKAVEPYLTEDSFQYLPDKKGSGGILSVDPYYESDELEELWDFDEILGRLIAIRAEILNGDLRPFYLAHLAVAHDSNHDPDETTEGPVPTGMKQLTDAQRALAELYGLSDALLAAAAQESPSRLTGVDPRDQYEEWLHALPLATKEKWLTELMADPQANLRTQLLAEFHKSRGAPDWPTVQPGRTIAELHAIAAGVRDKANRKAEAAAAAKRAKSLAGMAKDPTATLRETEKLVKQRGSDSYAEIASLLADLREVLAGTKQADLAEKQAQKLRNEHPTLRTLITELRKKGFLPK